MGFNCFLEDSNDVDGSICASIDGSICGPLSVDLPRRLDDLLFEFQAHRQANFVDLKNPLCQEKDKSGGACRRRATYGLYVRNARTSHPPSFTSAGTQVASSRTLVCRLHSKAGFIDLVNKRRCIVEGCTNLATFVEAPHRRPIKCLNHVTNSSH